jgi:hypothetical protein
MFVTKKEQPNRVGHHLKRTAQRKFDILKFGQLSAQQKKGEGEEKNWFFLPCCMLPVAVAASSLHIRKGYPSLFLSPSFDISRITHLSIKSGDKVTTDCNFRTNIKSGL